MSIVIKGVLTRNGRFEFIVVDKKPKIINKVVEINLMDMRSFASYIAIQNVEIEGGKYYTDKAGIKRLVLNKDIPRIEMPFITVDFKYKDVEDMTHVKVYTLLSSYGCRKLDTRIRNDDELTNLYYKKTIEEDIKQRLYWVSGLSWYETYDKSIQIEDRFKYDYRNTDKNRYLDDKLEVLYNYFKRAIDGREYNCFYGIGLKYATDVNVGIGLNLTNTNEAMEYFDKCREFMDLNNKIYEIQNKQKDYRINSMFKGIEGELGYCRDCKKYIKFDDYFGLGNIVICPYCASHSSVILEKNIKKYDKIEKEKIALMDKMANLENMNHVNNPTYKKLMRDSVKKRMMLGIMKMTLRCPNV